MTRTPLLKTAAAVALILGCALAFGGSARAADLELRFEGIKTPKGAVLVALFDSEAAYDADRPVASEMIPVAGETADRLLKGLRPGRYAFKAFHDLDGDFKMAVNPFGTPTEPFAFSNNAKADMRPAPWAKAVFELDEAGAVHAVHID